MIDLQAHYQALYDAMDPVVDVPIFHVTSADYQTNAPADPPFVVYRQDVERAPAGTRAGGTNKVMRSNFIISAYTITLGEGLDLISNIVNQFEDTWQNIVTSDGYQTTNIEVLNVQSIYEKDGKNYAVHCRVEWERSR